MKVPQLARMRLGGLAGDDRLRYSIVTLAARKPVAIEPDRLVGTAGQPVFSGGWSNLGAPFGPVRFWRTSDGWVHLAGVAKNPNPDAFLTPIFTLPSGYRPPYEQRVQVFGQRFVPAGPFTPMNSGVEQSAPVTITAEGRFGAGWVWAVYGVAAATISLSLDGIRFRST